MNDYGDMTLQERHDDLWHQHKQAQQQIKATLRRAELAEKERDDIRNRYARLSFDLNVATAALDEARDALGVLLVVAEAGYATASPGTLEASRFNQAVARARAAIERPAPLGRCARCGQPLDNLSRGL